MILPVQRGDGETSIMLSFEDRYLHHGRWQRRQFLRAGALALGGLSLGDALAVKAAAAGEKSPLKDRSVIFLFMHGGPSQFETFDPKMEAPSHIRSVTGEIPTTLPGITFGSSFSGWRSWRTNSASCGRL